MINRMTSSEDTLANLAEKCRDASAENRTLALSKDEAPDTEFGAVMYIIAVLTFYSLGIVVMIVKYLKTERKEMEEEMILETFFKGIPDKRMEHERNAVNRVAIMAFHTLTAGKEKPPDSAANSTRSSYTEFKASSRNSREYDHDDQQEEIHKGRRSNFHNLQNINDSCDTAQVPRRGMPDDRGFITDQDSSYDSADGGINRLITSRHSEDFQYQEQRDNLQLSPTSLVDDKGYGEARHHGGKHWSRSAHMNHEPMLDEEQLEHLDDADRDIYVYRPSTDQRPDNSEPQHNVRKKLPTSELKHQRHIPRSSIRSFRGSSSDTLQGSNEALHHRVSFEGNDVVHLIDETYKKSDLSCFDREEPVCEKSKLLSKKQSTSLDATVLSEKSAKEPCTSSGPSISKTYDPYADDSSGFSVPHQQEYRNKKKDKGVTHRTRLRLPRISISRSSVRGSSLVPAPDTTPEKSQYKSTDSKKEGKKARKSLLPAKYTQENENTSNRNVFQKMSRSKNTPAPDASTEAVSKGSRAGEDSQDLPTFMAKVASQLSDSPMYDSSSSLLPRCSGDSTPSQSPQLSSTKYPSREKQQPKTTRLATQASRSLFFSEPPRVGATHPQPSSGQNSERLASIAASSGSRFPETSSNDDAGRYRMGTQGRSTMPALPPSRETSLLDTSGTPAPQYQSTGRTQPVQTTVKFIDSAENQCTGGVLVTEL